MSFHKLVFTASCVCEGNPRWPMQLMLYIYLDDFSESHCNYIGALFCELSSLSHKFKRNLTTCFCLPKSMVDGMGSLTPPLVV